MLRVDDDNTNERDTGQRFSMPPFAFFVAQSVASCPARLPARAFWQLLSDQLSHVTRPRFSPEKNRLYILG